MSNPNDLVGGRKPACEPLLSSRTLRLSTLLWLVVIGSLTLTSAPDQVARVAETPWYCLACGDGSSTDILLNLLLFAPLGLLLRAQDWRLVRLALAACGLSLTIEMVQGAFLAGRDASLSDVLANTLGAVAGWLALSLLQQAARPSRRFAARAAAILLVVTSLLWLGTGVGLTPSLSRNQPWFGQPLRVWAGHDPFRGTFGKATFNGIVVEDDPLSALPATLDSLDVMVEVTSSDTVTPARRVSLLRIVDGKGKAQLSLTARRGDLLVDFPLRASRWGFRTPTWSFPGTTHIPLATRWRWHLVRTPHWIELRSGVANEPAAVQQLPLSIGLGWALVHPFGPPVGRHADWWTVLWIAGWMALLGWFAGALGMGARVTVGSLAVATFLLSSLATGLPVRAIEIVALLIGFLLPCLLSSRIHPGNAERGVAPPEG